MKSDRKRIAPLHVCFAVHEVQFCFWLFSLDKVMREVFQSPHSTVPHSPSHDDWSFSILLYRFVHAEEIGKWWEQQEEPTVSSRSISIVIYIYFGLVFLFCPIHMHGKQPPTSMRNIVHRNASDLLMDAWWIDLQQWYASCCKTLCNTTCVTQVIVLRCCSLRSWIGYVQRNMYIR